MDKEYTFDKLIKELKIKKEENKIKNKIVLIFDESLIIKENQLNELLNYFEGKEVLIVEMKENNMKYSDNVKRITFYKNMKKDYLSPDKIHLTNKGNEALIKEIEKEIKKNM